MRDKPRIEDRLTIVAEQPDRNGKSVIRAAGRDKVIHHDEISVYSHYHRGEFAKAVWEKAVVQCLDCWTGETPDLTWIGDRALNAVENVAAQMGVV